MKNYWLIEKQNDTEEVLRRVLHVVDFATSPDHFKQATAEVRLEALKKMVVHIMQNAKGQYVKQNVDMDEES